MNEMVAQSIMWILSIGAFALYMQRRRKRKSDY